MDYCVYNTFKSIIKIKVLGLIATVTVSRAAVMRRLKHCSESVTDFQGSIDDELGPLL